MIGTERTLIQGGLVYDGGGGPPMRANVLIDGSKILDVGDRQPADGDVVFDAHDRIVTPGLIDIHAHVYHGMGVYSIDPARAGLMTGVTTLLDAGSAGSLNYGTFHEYVMPQAREDVFALLNIAQMGVHGYRAIEPFVGDLHEIRRIHVPSAVQCIEAHGDRIVGTKVRLTADLADHRKENEYAGLHGVVEAAKRTNLPCMIHHASSAIPQPEMLDALRAGDIVTHMYHGRGDGGFTDPGGAPTDAMRRARDRGILFDVGHGVGSFDWSVAEPACREFGFWPDLIGTDVHAFNVGGPVYDLPTTMSKFLYLGMSLENVIRACTSVPARAIRLDDSRGWIKPGFTADISILDMQEGNVELADVEGDLRMTDRRLIPVATFKDGKLFRCSKYPV